jgi:hypothetical protein
MYHALLRVAYMTTIDMDEMNDLPNDDTVLFDICQARARTPSVKIAPAGGLIFIGASMTIPLT